MKSRISEQLTPDLRKAVRLFLRCYGKAIVVSHPERLDHLPDPVIFAANHNAAFETVVLAAYLMDRLGGKKVSFLVDWMYRYIPVAGWFLDRMDPISVYNKAARLPFVNRYRRIESRESAVEECVRYLKRKRSIVIFPEGTRNKHPFHLLKGKKGIGEIVFRTGAPVLPVGIDFPERIKRGRIPGFGRIILRFGELLNFNAEIEQWQTISGFKCPDPVIARQMRSAAASRITYIIMKELSRLSGKIYPFDPPSVQPDSGRTGSPEERKVSLCHASGL